MTPPPIRLGRYELRPDTRQLCEHGRPLRIGERAFDILRALVDADGRPLSRDALFDRAWPRLKEPVERHWPAYVNGDARLDDVVRKTVADLE